MLHFLILMLFQNQFFHFLKNLSNTNFIWIDALTGSINKKTYNYAIGSNGFGRFLLSDIENDQENNCRNDKKISNF